ncbi:MAG TPA: hypothetical protein VJC00_03690 [Candidatus Nanoarchaeia archaeon]|nr:hypothetical protein [Candidatus Nanoarchaeia archaeon]
MKEKSKESQLKKDSNDAVEYPDSTVAVSSSGKKEARVLESMGSFVRYGYVDILSGKKVRKYSILLKDEKGNVDHLFVVPTGPPSTSGPSGQKEIVVKHVSEGKKKRAIYDPKSKKTLEF